MAENTCTLVIRHLPSQLTYEDKVNFLKQCGATNVKVLASKVKKYNIAFADFPSKSHAEQALHHLHQQEVLGSYLVVEYARGRIPSTDDVEDTQEENLRLKQLKETNTEALRRRFLDKLNKWSGTADFRAPIPSHLRYHYPPPNPSTLRNITHYLATSPPFYTQVLHLMNKMNLPCPIATDTTIPFSQIESSIQALPHPPLPQPVENESESELSSEEGNTRETIPEMKPKIKKTIKRKILKPVATSAPKQGKKTAFEDVFEDPKAQVEPKRKLPKLETKTDEGKQDVGFGFIHPVGQPKPDNDEIAVEVEKIRNPLEEERLQKPEVNCITLEKLNANRLSEQDRATLPVYKNYAEGAPTCRLYLKNLAKQTTEEDLRFIYSKFLSDDALLDSPNIFDIRLMKEGRMKGQAFVTLQTVELAKEALQATNGYILNDKPMVVQYARSATKEKLL